MEINISRFKGIHKRDYELEVVTPLFLGGADPKKAEIRTAPFKAAIRFWWRAIYGSDNIEAMRKKESEIFGNTEKKSSLLISVFPQLVNEKCNNLKGGKTYSVNSSKMNGPITLRILDYLAYGLYKYNNVYRKAFINPGEKFNISLRFPSEFEEQILKAFEAMILFGGIGAKSRNGFGSLFCKDIKKTFSLSDFEKKDLNSFTSFSRASKLFDNFSERDTWQDALSDIGLIYREARLALEKKHQYERRSLIAMPIVAKGEKIPKDIEEGRHPKTYFLHVKKTENNKFKGQILFLPYNYYIKSKMKEYEDVNDNMIKKILSTRGAK
ncbi:MAG: type III-B CRISPR module RAMP protein Cmr1 [Calditerrivibrio sp.]|nr:type III-B CRISPR module RAMP protein Cmr1 [Calditerrivibrio sp.]MCA1980396.1 type III-B CRISPR module RAMP protein Cmr1 [Calditerrivibrio sp.]